MVKRISKQIFDKNKLKKTRFNFLVTNISKNTVCEKNSPKIDFCVEKFKKTDLRVKNNFFDGK